MNTLYELPRSYFKRCIVRCCSEFREATVIRKAEMPITLPKDHLLVRNIAVGINASDLNYVMGVYRQRIDRQLSQYPSCGFEAVGVVVAVPEMCQKSQSLLGSVVLASSYSAFSEYQIVRRSNCYKLPRDNIQSVISIGEFDRLATSIYDSHSRFLPLTLSGATALLSLSVAFRTMQSLSLGKFSPLFHPLASSPCGLYQTNQRLTVLTTAAAGAFGHLLTQLFTHYFPNSTIIAVTSSDSKGEWVKRHCFGNKSTDRIVLCYEKNSIDTQLAEYFLQKTRPLNMIFDSVGGESLELVMRYSSNKSVTMVIGSTSQYTSTKKASMGNGDSISSFSRKLLSQSSTMVGFFLPHYAKFIPNAVEHLVQLTLREEISPQIDTRKTFEGLEDISSAVEHLYSKQSCGKVIVRLI